MNTSENKIYEGLSEESYASMPYISASVIRATVKYNQEHVFKVMQQTSFDHQVHSLGRWIHYFILEAPEEEFESHSGCPAHLYPSLEKARKAFNENSDYLRLINESKREVTLVWKDSLLEGEAKARLDILHKNFVLDLKCIRGGYELKSFDLKLKKMAWPIQAWWYQRAVREVLDLDLETGFMVLDTQTWRVRTQMLTKQDLEKASNQARESIRKLKRWSFV